MKAEERKQIKAFIEKIEYYSNFLHRINGASVNITNLKEKDGRYYYTATLIYSERGDRSIYDDCYIDKAYLQEQMKKK